METTTELNEIRNRTNRRIFDFENKIKNLKKAIADDDDQKECLSCRFVTGVRMGLAKISSTNCKLCQKEVLSGSTDLNHLCDNCATKNGLCVRCGCNKNEVKDSIQKILK